MSKFVLQDKLFRDENGNVYTKQYVEHNKDYLKDETLTEINKTYEKTEPYTIYCNYSQLFEDCSQMLICNNIQEIEEFWYENITNGELYWEDEDGEEVWTDVYQFFLIDHLTSDFLKKCTNEIIFYSEKLDLDVLCVTHWGTSWDYVGAKITCDRL